MAETGKQQPKENVMNDEILIDLGQVSEETKGNCGDLPEGEEAQENPRDCG